MSITGAGEAFYGWQGIRPDTNKIPMTLQAVDQWVLWKATEKPKGGMNKVPHQPNGRKAKSTDLSTFSDFETVWGAYMEAPHEYAGLGFVVTEQDRFIGIDLDHCRNAETGELTPKAWQIVEALQSYTEVTPSGTGIRIFCEGALERSFKGEGIEVYSSGRFLTVTGHRISDQEEPTEVDPKHLERLRQLATGRTNESPSSSDRVVLALKKRSLYQKPLDGGRHQITCPWWHEHTGEDITGTVYMEAYHNGHDHASFVCQHAHCGQRRLSDLLEYLQLKDAPEDYPLIWMADTVPKLGGPSLLRGVIQPNTMVVTYGESGSGKTFHILDRDLCISAGRKWYDREAERGFVLYVAAEGPHSVQNRVAAYRQQFMPDLVTPFAILPRPLNLLDPQADVNTLIEFVKRTQEQIDARCVKITADTLARVISGGNENSPEDMGALVNNADSIRHELGCTFEFCHHSGKNTALGARGHSSLRAATDTEIEVTLKDDLHVATVTKQRDGPEGDQFAYTLRTVPLGEDQYGHPVTTCVPEWQIGAKHSRRPDMTFREHEVMRKMQELMRKEKLLPPRSCFDAPNPPEPGQIACPVGHLRDLVRRSGGLSDSDKADTQERAFRRCIVSLQAKGFIGVFDDWAWLADKADIGGHSG